VTESPVAKQKKNVANVANVIIANVIIANAQKMDVANVANVIIANVKLP
jgi:hypothetical protein